MINYYNKYNKYKNKYNKLFYGAGHGIMKSYNIEIRSLDGETINLTINSIDELINILNENIIIQKNKGYQLLYNNRIIIKNNNIINNFNLFDCDNDIIFDIVYIGLESVYTFLYDKIEHYKDYEHEDDDYVRYLNIPAQLVIFKSIIETFLEFELKRNVLYYESNGYPKLNIYDYLYDYEYNEDEDNDQYLTIKYKNEIYKHIAYIDLTYHEYYFSINLIDKYKNSYEIILDKQVYENILRYIIYIKQNIITQTNTDDTTLIKLYIDTISEIYRLFNLENIYLLY